MNIEFFIYYHSLEKSFTFNYCEHPRKKNFYVCVLNSSYCEWIHLVKRGIFEIITRRNKLYIQFQRTNTIICDSSLIYAHPKFFATDQRSLTFRRRSRCLSVVISAVENFEKKRGIETNIPRSSQLYAKV